MPDLDPDLPARLAKAIADTYAEAGADLLRIVAARLARGIDEPGWAEAKLAEVLRLRDVDPPAPAPDELLVDVHHAALNRADVLQRMGAYPDPRRPPVEIPGMEYAGVVAAMGDRVRGWAVGDAVMGIESGGCYAEQVVTNARQALPVPAGLDQK